MAKKRLRGVTLLEITIVMAVTAIMLTGIVSMCVSVNGISARNAQVSEVVGAVADCQSLTRDWLSYFDKDGIEIELIGSESATEGSTINTKLQAKQGDAIIGSLYLDVANHIFVAEYDNDKKLTRSASTIYFVSFVKYDGTDNGEKIISCTLNYNLLKSNGSQQTTTQSFVIATRRQPV